MIYVVKELPPDVQLSEHLRGRAAFYLCFQSFGINYYIPATDRIRRLLCLDKQGRDMKPDLRRRYWSMDKADALRDIVNALELQVRDNVLAGIEEDVRKVLLDRMEEVMAPTVRRLVQDRAQKRLANATEMPHKQ